MAGPALDASMPASHARARRRSCGVAAAVAFRTPARDPQSACTGAPAPGPMPMASAIVPGAAASISDQCASCRRRTAAAAAPRARSTALFCVVVVDVTKDAMWCLCTVASAIRARARRSASVTPGTRLLYASTSGASPPEAAHRSASRKICDR